MNTRSRNILDVGMAYKYPIYFFVDDILLFFHAQISDIHTIQEILELYGKFRANRLIQKKPLSSLVSMFLLKLKTL